MMFPLNFRHTKSVPSPFPAFPTTRALHTEWSKEEKLVTPHLMNHKSPLYMGDKNFYSVSMRILIKMSASWMSECLLLLIARLRANHL